MSPPTHSSAHDASADADARPVMAGSPRRTRIQDPVDHVADRLLGGLVILAGRPEPAAVPGDDRRQPAVPLAEHPEHLRQRGVQLGTSAARPAA